MFILARKFTLEFFPNCAFLIVCMMTFYSRFNLSHSIKRLFLTFPRNFSLNNNSEYLLLYFECFCFDFFKVYFIVCLTIDSEFKVTPTKRRAFCKELKLNVINWYFENGKNINQTCNNFETDQKQMKNWFKDEEKIRSLKLSRKSCQYGKVKFPFIEKERFSKFLICARKINVPSTSGWNSKARELVKEKYPDEVSTFKLSYRWLEGFWRCRKISLRRKNSCSLKVTSNAIENSHSKSLQGVRRGTYTLKDLANMDQILLPFVMGDNTIFEKSGANEISIASDQSDLEKVHWPINHFW